MYLPHVIALLLFAISIFRYVSIGRWEAHLVSIAAAAFGLACAVVSHEVADWTGRYSWTSDSFWTYPPNLVRAFGFILLVAVQFFGFR